MKVCSGSLADSADIVVVGSGAAALTAALSALDAGARVLVTEKSSVLGGTSAVSGGMIWIPCSDHAARAGIADSLDDALTYATAVTRGRGDPELLAAHLRRGNELLGFLAGAGVEFTLVESFPDYHPNLPGGSTGGRSLEPELFDITTLGGLESCVRGDPHLMGTTREYFEVWRTFANFPLDHLEERRRRGIVSRGRALVSSLVKAVADRGGTLLVENAAQRLLFEERRVVGVLTEDGAVRAGATILASGGFEWSEDLCQRFLSGPISTRCSTPANVGDGLRMALAAGVDLANMNEAWWGVYCDVPGVELDGHACGTLVTLERALPGTVVVNRQGQRFTNEAASYYTFGKVLATFDEWSYGYRHLPAYLVADAVFFRRYGFLGVSDIESLPGWIVGAASLSELAERLGIDAEALVSTISRFNAFAREGRDRDFHRGESAYDRYVGDPSAPHPNLGELSQPPFLAVELKLGAIGTKGGVRTDVDGRALDPWGDPIAGLYAVGNVSAHPIAFGYVGAGSTLGPAMTMARAAGLAAADSVAGRAPSTLSPVVS
jgi:succinate dehydrogenase/fumarate reductase flavoprotein subunit